MDYMWATRNIYFVKFETIDGEEVWVSLDKIIAVMSSDEVIENQKVSVVLLDHVKSEFSVLRVPGEPKDIINRIVSFSD